MANSINWGKIYDNTYWGIGVSTNTISWGKVYSDLAGLQPSFSLDFDTIADNFTFTRNSFATRVNENGLIETVTDLGPDLVQNGSFDELGSEQVTNGDFSNGSTDWTITQSGSDTITIENGYALFNCPNNSNIFISQGNLLTVGKTYKASVDLLSIDSGGLQFAQGGGATISGSPSINTVGTHTFTFVASTATFAIKRKLGAPNLLNAKIDNVSVQEVFEDDLPRIDYSTGEAAFLLEPTSTNLINYSEDFTQWNAISNPTVTLNQAISPDGTNNATLLEFDQTVTTSRIEVFAPSGGASDWVFSVWAKSVSGNDVSFGMEIGSALSPEKERVATSEWKRFYKVGSTTGATNIYPQIESWTTNNESIYIWGAQLEALSYATSYIPTNGSVVTRAQESCVDATPTINSEEGVLYAEISALADSDDFRVIELNDKTEFNRVLFYYRDNDRIVFSLKINNVNVLAETVSSANVTGVHKLALLWSQDNFSAWVDGVKVNSVTSGNTFAPNTLIDLDFSDPFGSLPFYGNTKDLKVYDKALTDEELTELTTI